MTPRKASNRKDHANDLPFKILEMLAGGIRPSELSVTQRDRLRDSALAQARDTAPEGTATVRSSAAQWKSIGPLVEMLELRRDPRNGTHVSLMRMRPGGRVEPHTHNQEEDFIVLDGECRIGAHVLRAGDVHTAGPGSMHDTTVSEEGVLVLIRGEFPYPEPRAESAKSV